MSARAGRRSAYWAVLEAMRELHETKRSWGGTAKAVNKSVGLLNVGRSEQRREVRACTDVTKGCHRRRNARGADGEAKGHRAGPDSLM